MTKISKNKSIEEYEARIRLFVKSKKYHSLKEVWVKDLANLYNIYGEGIEFVTNNSELSDSLECKPSKTKSLTRAAQATGFLNKRTSSAIKGDRIFTYLHCTLAELPELTTTDLSLDKQQKEQEDSDSEVTNDISKQELVKIKSVIRTLSGFYNRPFAIIKALCEYAESNSEEMIG